MGTYFDADQEEMGWMPSSAVVIIEFGAGARGSLASVALMEFEALAGVVDGGSRRAWRRTCVVDCL